jgi:hypothetical protein
VRVFLQNSSHIFCCACDTSSAHACPPQSVVSLRFGPFASQISTGRLLSPVLSVTPSSPIRFAHTKIANVCIIWHVAVHSESSHNLPNPHHFSSLLLNREFTLHPQHQPRRCPQPNRLVPLHLSL